VTAVLLAGAVCGLGLHLLIRLVLRPDGGHASGAVTLAELDADRRRQRRAAALATDTRFGGESVRLRRLGGAVLDAAQARGVRLPVDLRRDLALTGRSPALHLAHSILGGVVGLLLFLVLAAVAGLAVPALGGPTPIWVGLLGGLIGVLLPTIAVRSRADGLRRDFRHVVGSFLDLVAMNLAGGRGIPEALGSAASVSPGWAMSRVRECLETARLQGITPWSALGTLGTDTGVDELRDLSAALALVADDGAKVRQSLAARATSLRRRELADAEGRAQARSQSMLVAQLLLALGFLIFLIYPAVARILGS
jgi:Flp pilus assembly protein TadB